MPPRSQPTTEHWKWAGSKKLFNGILLGRGPAYDVSADGQKFLVVDDGTTSARPLTLIQNWMALLRT